MPCIAPGPCSDKRKKVKGKKPGAGADKTDRKTERNEEKRSRRLERAAQARWGQGRAAEEEVHWHALLSANPRQGSMGTL